MQSFRSPFTQLARTNLSPREVATLMNCDLQTAKQGLQEGRRALAEREDRMEQAVQILLHSALTVPQVQTREGDRPCSRWGAWQDVALGLKKAA